MAQIEDTELRDLVIEALDKNGSLAKIRALLRANVFLAFEDECANMKHNPALDNILQLPEGLLALSIVHEFLEFCNLKNTLFVYTSESRQNKDYHYEGEKLAERLSLPRTESNREPVLISLIKKMYKTFDIKLGQQHSDNHKGAGDKNYKDEENCTYIVHEDSSRSTTSNSHSDSSSDEKNKLHLRLHLDNSDTDTSSDSAREKSCSEYIPSEHILNTEEKVISPPRNVHHSPNSSIRCLHNNEHVIHSPYLQELKLFKNSSSDSTSFAEIKSFNKLDEKMINTAGVPFVENKSSFGDSLSTHTVKSLLNQPSEQSTEQTTEDKLISASNTTLSMSSTKKQMIDNGAKSNTANAAGTSQYEETAEYSYDFTSPRTPPSLSTKNSVDPSHLSQSIQEVLVESLNKSLESPNKNSQSPHSSVSISDVADLISESYLEEPKKSDDKMLATKKKSNGDQHKASDDSGDFSESPIPSFSNLSLDMHSD